MSDNTSPTRTANDGTTAVDPATNGHKGLLLDNPFDNPDSKLARCNAEDARKGRWRNHRYALSALDGRRERWARHVVTAAEVQNASRDPERGLPVLMFTGDTAVEAGATDEEIAALPRLSPDQIAEVKIEAAAMREHARQRIRKRARALASPPRPPLSEVVRLARDMVDDPPAADIVDGLLYETMVVSWPGPGGSYKTFAVLALACSVAAGRDFTHQLRVPEKRPVLVMCAESRRNRLIGDIRAWCEISGVDVDGLDVRGWDDVVQLGDDEGMAELTEYVIERGIKLVVFDTQRKATRGLEENSSTDMGVAVANAQSLARKAEAAVVVIHHTGWAGDHARGSSVWHDDTDATVMQQRTGDMEAELVIQKHKSVAVGPIRVTPVTVERAPVPIGGDAGRPTEPIRTLVAQPRDPLTIDERSEHTAASLSPDDRILVSVVNANDGSPLSPAVIHRQAEALGYERGEDFTREHLRRLADPEAPVITGHHNPMTNRWTYSAKATAGPQD